MHPQTLGDHPGCVLMGSFAHWVDLYPEDLLVGRYGLVTCVEANWPLGYGLYAANE